MSRFGEVLKNVILKEKTDIYNRIHIVSAYAGITNYLLEHKKTGTPGIYQIFEQGEDCEQAMTELQNRLCELNSSFAAIGLDVETADQFICRRINFALNILKSMNIWKV